MALRARLVLAAALLGAAAAPGVVRADETASRLDAVEDRALRDEARARFDEALRGFQEAFGTAVREAAASPDPPGAARLRARAEVYLAKVDELAGRTQAHRRADEFLKGFSEDELGPVLKGWVDWERVGFLRRAGDPDGSRELIRSLGFVTRWWVVGPFDNERGRGFGAKAGPETEEGIAVDLAASYPGKERPVSWRPVPAVHPYGWIDLDAMLRPNDQALAYAVTWIRCDAPLEAALRFGSDEALAVWVNGTEVLRREVIRRGGFDQDAAGVVLQKGWNRILVKVGDTTGPWGFRMRVTAPDGRPVADAAVPGSDDEAQAAAAAAETRRPATRSGVARGALDALGPAAPLGKTADEGSEDARAYFYLGVLHRARQYDDQKEAQTDRRFLDRAARLRPDDAVYAFHAAEAASRPIDMAVEKEENGQRRGREKALDLDPEYAVAYAALAGYYTFSLPNLPRAEELARKAISIHGEFLEAHLLLCEILRRRGFPTEASLALDAVLARPDFRGRTQYLNTLARQGDQAGLLAAAADACRRALDADAEDAEARRRLAEVLKREGLAADAVGVFDERVRLNPFDLDAWRQKAHFLEGLERLPDAAGAAAAGLAVAPEDRGLLDLQGRLLHRLGRKDDAVAQWKEALRVDPKNTVLKRYVEWLDPSLKPFEVPYIEDAGALLAAVKGREDANPENDPFLVVLDRGATRVNPDGTTSAFTQKIVKILNNRGAKMNARYSAGFFRGEQSFEWRAARVWRKDGTLETASVQAGSPVVAWPQLQPGDAFEVQHRVDQLRQTFFGDYFGETWGFADAVPVARSAWTLLVPASREIRIRARNMPGDAGTPRTGTTEDGKWRTYDWALRDLAKVRGEPRMPHPSEKYPVVEVTTYEAWNRFADWWWSLIKQQFIADDGMKAKVEELTKDAKTRLDKVRAIYDFVVTDIQYQAWEFGVHGYKPYTASAIFNRRWGDCKDKAILLRTLLDQVGVECYPVLIRAVTNRDPGRSEEDMDLAQVGKFNHCIAWVPDADGEGRGLFLDGTAQYHSLESLPSMDRGAKVLVVKPGGAEVVQIPWNTPEERFFGQEFDVLLEPNGSAALAGTLSFRGDRSVMARAIFSVEGKRDLVLQELLGPAFGKNTLEEKTFPDLKDLSRPEVSVGLKLRVEKFGEVEGSRMSLPVKFVDLANFAGLAPLTTLERREHDLLLRNPAGFRTRAVIHVPEGWAVSKLPDARNLETPFARLRISARVEGSTVVFEREEALTAPRVPRDLYPAFRDFVAGATAALTERIVLERAAAPAGGGGGR